MTQYEIVVRQIVATLDEILGHCPDLLTAKHCPECESLYLDLVHYGSLARALKLTGNGR